MHVHVHVHVHGGWEAGNPQLLELLLCLFNCKLPLNQSLLDDVLQHCLFDEARFQCIDVNLLDTFRSLLGRLSGTLLGLLECQQSVFFARSRPCLAYRFFSDGATA